MPESPPPDVFHNIVNELEVGVYIVDRFRKITYWNKGAEKLTGYLRQDVVGRFCRDNILVHCDQEGHELCGDECPLLTAMGEGAVRDAQIYLRHHDGHRVPVHVQALPLRDESGAVTGAAEIFVERVEVPEFTAPETVLAACGCLDEESGLANRALTESYLSECMARFRNHRMQFAVFVIRIDRFGEFLAQHGREAAAAMMRSAARTIQHSLPPGGFLGRWDGHRLLLIMPYTERALLEKIGDRMRVLIECTTVPWWGDHLSIGASVGMTKDQPDDTPEALLSRVETCIPDDKPAGTEQGAGAGA